MSAAKRSPPDLQRTPDPSLLNNGDGTFAPQVTYTVDTYPSDVAVGDFNGDGRPDIVAVTGIGVSVLLNNGFGSF